jgi:hypothetical protein
VATEDLNRQWYERNTGNAIKEAPGKAPGHPGMAATLDGVVAGSGAVYEAKQDPRIPLTHSPSRPPSLGRPDSIDTTGTMGGGFPR